MQKFRMALSFMSRIPVGKLKEVPAQDWALTLPYFPLVGYILGALSILPVWGISLLDGELSELHFLLCGALVVATLAYLTRGLHLDGLGDMADGFGVWTKERRLEVMKDSRNGAFAVITLVIHLLLKTILLAQLIQEETWFPIIGTIAFSRFIIVWMCNISTYPREKGTASAMVGNTPLKRVLYASLFLIPLLFAPELLIMAVVATLTMFIIKRKADDMIGGVTGDILGATVELTESAGFLSLILFSL